MVLKFLLPLAFGVLSLCSPITPRDAEPVSPIVNLGYAKYQGLRLDVGVDQFLGMRYAQAPLGDLRFRAPQDPPKNYFQQITQDASSFGPICIGIGQTASATIAEDCLFVNVFKPSNATRDSKLPVWVYIQGGGYRSNSNANYNGTGVVQQSGYNLILVNFNYRVGSLGFLAGESVRQDGDLNAGLLDQRKVLHWVQKYIHLFGGDPDHVVIHGASAGGGSVAHHLVAYGGNDEHLFIGASPESPFWPTLRTVDDMEFQFAQLVNSTGCLNASDHMACLRGLDLSDLMSASKTYYPFPGGSTSPVPIWYWLPVIDGSLISDEMYTLFSEGRFIHVPLLVGDDTDEGTAFANNATTANDMNTFLKNNYPNLDDSQLQAIDSAYPLTDTLPRHAAYFPSVSAAYGDATFTCPGNHLAETMAKYFSPNKVWNYRYNVIDAANEAAGMGVPHTFESAAIFGTGYGGSVAASYSTMNAAIIPVTMNYWISFVRYLDPNQARYEGSPVWEPWGSEDGRRLKLETNATAMEDVPTNSTSKCELWRGLATTMQV